MFSHLVESDPHTVELKRKGTFFLATMAAYEAHIDDQNLELVALVPPETEAPRQREIVNRPKVSEPNVRPDSGSSRNLGGPRQTAPSNTSSDMTRIAGAAQASTTQLPPENIRGGDGTFPFSTGSYNPNANRSGTSSNNTADTRGDGIDAPPPAFVKKSEPPRQQRIPYIGPVNSQALSLPQPAYPEVAKIAKAQGPVTVEILIDETGRVISARATSGNPLLRAESEKAAYRARFSPTMLQNQPVKAKGVITFNFILTK